MERKSKKSEKEPTLSKAKEFSNFEIFSFVTLLLTFFLLPFFYLPFLGTELVVVKTGLITGGVLVSFLLFLLFTLKKNLFPYKKSLLLGLVWFLPIAYLASSVTSSSFGEAFSGSLFEAGTCVFIALMALITSLTAILFSGRERISSFLFSFLLSAFLLLVIEFLALFVGVDLFPSKGVGALDKTILGGWNNFALFSGLVIMVSILILENVREGWFLKIILYLLIFLSLIFLITIDFTLAWVMLFIFSFALAVYFLFKHRVGWSSSAFVKNKKNSISSHSRYFFILPIIVLILSGGSLMVKELPFAKTFLNDVEIAGIEARPSWNATLTVAKGIYSENWLFGSGPNTFERGWAKYKPEAINNSIFWQQGFSSGVGFLPTEFSATGIFGTLAWFAFLFCFLIIGLRCLLFKRAEDEFSYVLPLTSFLGALYLWATLIFYDTNSVLVAFAFAFTGIFIASTSFFEGQDGKKVLHFSERPRLGFVMVFLASILVIAVSVWLYMGSQKYIAYAYFKNASQFFNENKIDASESYLSKAVSMNESDVYYRLKADIALQKIENMFSLDSGTLSKEDKENFRKILSSAINSSRQATKIDPGDHRNWTKLADVYASVIPLKVEGAYEKAVEKYEKAMELTPASPKLYLKRARLEFSQENFGKAREYVGKAIDNRSGYTEAVYLLSKIYIAEGNIGSAIRSTKSAINMSPNDPALFFQLGLLEYKRENYKKASEALEKSVEMEKGYANAKYYLGLSYYKIGSSNKALKQFIELKRAHPDKEELNVIVENLKAGRSPFADISEEKPDKKEGLPLKEESNI